MARKRIGALLALIALAALLLAGCAGSEPAENEGASMSGSVREQGAGERMLLNVTVAQAGDPVGIDCRGLVGQGSLRAQLVDAGDQVVWQEAAGVGVFQFNTTLQPAPGKYRLGLAWDGPVQAQYALVYRPHAIAGPGIDLLALLPGAGMVAVAIGFVAYALRRRLGARYVAFGALAWVLTVALKFAWAVPINPPLERALSAALPPWLSAPLFYVYVGSLTGIFEVGVTYLLLRRRWSGAPWKHALAFGIGFGAVEAAFVALNWLVTVLVAPAGLTLLPPDAMAALNSVLQGLAPVWERFFIVWVHIFSNVLIFYALAVRRPRWFWLAFTYKTAVDTVAVGMQATATASLAGLWTTEMLIALFGIVGWLGTRWLRSRYPIAVEQE